MLSLFRSNNIILGLLLIPYAFLLRSFAFFGKVPTEFDNGGIFSDWIYEFIGLNDIALVSISFGLVLIQSYIIYMITKQHKLLGEENLFPAIFYLITASISISFLGLPPPLIGNTFLLLAIANLFNIYKLKEASSYHFNAGFFIALASLCYGSLGIFLLFGMIAIASLRVINIKEFLQLISGYIVPYFILFTIFYYLNEIEESYIPYILSAFGRTNLRESLGQTDYITLVFILILFLGILSQYRNIVDKQISKTKKQIRLLFYFIIFVVASTIIQAGVGMEHLILLSAPFGILLAIIFTKMKKIIWMELWHLLLLIVIPLSHYLLT